MVFVSTPRPPKWESHRIICRAPEPGSGRPGPNARCATVLPLRPSRRVAGTQWMECPLLARLRMPRPDEDGYWIKDYPRLAAEWHHTRNGVVLPADVSYGSRVRYWWALHERRRARVWAARERGILSLLSRAVRAANERPGRPDPSPAREWAPDARWYSTPPRSKKSVSWRWQEASRKASALDIDMRGPCRRAEPGAACRHSSGGLRGQSSTAEGKLQRVGGRHRKTPDTSRRVQARDGRGIDQVPSSTRNTGRVIPHVPQLMTPPFGTSQRSMFIRMRSPASPR